MKFSVDAIKSADYKQLLIDHGEKVGLAVTGLVIAAVLFTGRWSGYSEKRPEEVGSEVSFQAAALEKSRWTPEVRDAAVPSTDIDERADALLTPTKPLAYVRPLNPPLVQVQDPIGEVPWLPVQEPLAEVHTIAMLLDPDRTKTDAELAEEAEEATEEDADSEDAEEDVPDQYRIQDGRGTGTVNTGGRGGPPGAGRGGAGALGMGGAGGSYGDEYGSDYGADYGDENGADMNGESGYESYGDDYGSEYGSGGYGAPAAKGPVGEGRGVKFVAVRGIVPFQRQIGELERALHIPAEEAYAKLEYLDFEIQRQRATAGADPWSGEWETVDQQAALKMIADSYGIDVDTVSFGVTDAVFTMPLPRRAMGVWGPEATHPKIANFATLDERGQKMQEDLQNQLIAAEEAKQKAGKTPGQPEVTRGGFAAAQYDTRKLARSGGLGETAAGGTPDPSKQAELDKVTAQGTLLLFRYFDPTPEPGQAYRYRVRLKVLNPNFGRGPDEVDDPAVAEGETRFTPWSVPTDPVIIPPDTRYFLTRTGESRDGSQVARIETVQWSREHGTKVMETLEVEPGQLIVETRQTRVIDPAGQTNDPKAKYTFDSHDALVDLNAYGGDVAAANPALKLSPQDAARALLLTGTGEVKELDAALLAEQAAAESEIAAFRKALASLEVEEKPAVDPYGEYGDEYGSGGYGDDYGGGYGGGGGRGRSRGGSR